MFCSFLAITDTITQWPGMYLYRDEIRPIHGKAKGHRAGAFSWWWKTFCPFFPPEAELQSKEIREMMWSSQLFVTTEQISPGQDVNLTNGQKKTLLRSPGEQHKLKCQKRNLWCCVTLNFLLCWPFPRFVPCYSYYVVVSWGKAHWLVYMATQVRKLMCLHLVWSISS